MSTGLLSWVALSSYEDGKIAKEAESIQKQGETLVQALEHTDFFKSSARVESHWEINNCISLMQSLYDERIVFIKGEHVLYDSLQPEKDGVISNDICGKTTELLSKAELEQIEVVKVVKENIVNQSDKELNVYIPVSIENAGEKEVAIVLISADLNSVMKTVNHLEERVATISILIIVLILLLAFFYSGKVVKPFKELITYINRITDGFLDEKANIKSYAELEEVVDSINHMTTKLETLESSRQEFVSNVSHELKTPITSIKVLADSLLQQEDAPAELYREFLSDINAEIERENKIITDLLSLVKMDKTAGELNITTININELLEQILKRIKPIAAKRNIDLVFESYRPVMAEVDEVKLSLAVNNLIENAVKYNYDNGWVRVSLNADHKFFYVKVSDSGVGIPEDEQENVFERFYRVDKARSRETGGTGLGLSITRNAILMHRGAIKIYSKEKEGTTFTVRIPLNHVGQQ